MKILYKDIWIRPNLAIEIWYNPIHIIFQYYLYFKGYVPKEDDELNVLSWIMEEILQKTQGGNSGN